MWNVTRLTRTRKDYNQTLTAPPFLFRSCMHVTSHSEAGRGDSKGAKYQRPDKSSKCRCQTPFHPGQHPISCIVCGLVVSEWSTVNGQTKVDSYFYKDGLLGVIFLTWAWDWCWKLECHARCVRVGNPACAWLRARGCVHLCCVHVAACTWLRARAQCRWIWPA